MIPRTEDASIGLLAARLERPAARGGMVAPRFRRKSVAVAALGALCLLVTAGCIESAELEKATLERDQARYAVGQRDRRVQELQWQLGYLGQQIQAIQQRDEASQRELLFQFEELKGQNRTLSERLGKAENSSVERPPVQAQETASGTAKGQRAPTADAAAPRVRPEELEKIERTLSAQHAQIIDMLSRIERIVRARDGRSNDRLPARPPHIDILDPWGYGDRR